MVQSANQLLFFPLLFVHLLLIQIQLLLVFTVILIQISLLLQFLQQDLLIHAPLIDVLYEGRLTPLQLEVLHEVELVAGLVEQTDVRVDGFVGGQQQQLLQVVRLQLFKIIYFIYLFIIIN